MAEPLIKIYGGRELRARMLAAGLKMQNLKEAHARVAKVAEGGIRAAAPKKSGRLASTIRSSGTTRAAIVRAGYKRTPYAGPNNWGWPEGAAGIKGSFGGDFWAQQGARQTESAWVAVYSAEIQKIADQV